MDCIKCNTKSCRTTEPCQAQKFDAEELILTYHLPENMKIVQAAAQLVDNGRAGTLSRLQEVIEFSRSMNFQRIGIAYCYGMEIDAALITTIFRESGFKVYPVSCTTGGFKQSVVNVTSKIEKVSCNPLAQAGQLNHESVDFTITVGLCLGHDILFNKHINSFTSTLLVKDRVHNHNPIDAIKNQRVMQEITSAEFEQHVLRGGKVVLDFYSTECPPCEAVAPKFEGLAALYGKDIKFVKMFRQQNKPLAESLGVRSSPTLLFFDNGVQLPVTLTGGIKRSDIIHQLDSMLSKERVLEIKKAIKPTVSEFDVLILGAGPGGLTAGLYLCQAKVNTVLIDIALPGGQVSTTHEVSNYPGFIDPQPGYMLSHNMSEQTKQCGTIYKVAVDVTKIDLEKKEVVIDEFETVRAKKIIIATGTSPNLMGIPGEKELKGKGISYCATCDAKYYGDKEVVVIGGGNSAVEEADFISRFASKITMVHQFDALTANKQAQEKLFVNPKTSILFSHEPRSFVREGDKMITEVEDLKTKTISKLASDGVFVFIGMKPNIDLFRDKLELDQWGYIKTNEDMQTSMPGIYAVGDVISKKYRQITTAVADGTIAAIAIAKELN